jgi:hypothetical protein
LPTTPSSFYFFFASFYTDSPVLLSRFLIVTFFAIVSSLSSSKIGQRMPTCVPTNYKVLRVRGNCKEGEFDPDVSKGICDKDWITKLTFALSHL